MHTYVIFIYNFSTTESFLHLQDGLEKGEVKAHNILKEEGNKKTEVQNQF